MFYKKPVVKHLNLAVKYFLLHPPSQYLMARLSMFLPLFLSIHVTDLPPCSHNFYYSVKKNPKWKHRLIR